MSYMQNIERVGVNVNFWRGFCELDRQNIDSKREILQNLH